MDIPLLQTRFNRPPGQPPTSWNQTADTGHNGFPPSPASNLMDNGVPGAESVPPQVIATTALPALARQDKEVAEKPEEAKRGVPVSQDNGTESRGQPRQRRADCNNIEEV